MAPDRITNHLLSSLLTLNTFYDPLAMISKNSLPITIFWSSINIHIMLFANPKMYLVILLCFFKPQYSNLTYGLYFGFLEVLRAFSISCTVSHTQGDVKYRTASVSTDDLSFGVVDSCLVANRTIPIRSGRS